MRVALFSPSMTWGGAEKMFKRLAIGFGQAGLDVDLVLASAVGPNLVDLPGSVRVIDLHSRRLLASSRPLARYLRDKRPGVLISTQDHANLVAVWARFLARTSTQLILREANTLSVASSNSRDIRERVVPWLARTFYRAADVVVAVSRGVAEDLVNNVGVPRSMVRVIYNPTVDSDLALEMVQPVSHPWLGDGGPPVLLAVGRLGPQKRFDALIRAVAIVCRTRPVRVLILGDGEERERLQSLARELGVEHCVSLPGFVVNPCAYMSQADLYVLSSAWEGLPNALIEALACGLPVVSTDCPSGPREILAADHHGTSPLGQLVSVDDPMGMAEAILKELGLERDPARLRHRAQRFASERAVRAYLDLMHVGA
jgi:glycosyltransferase involved in cell wall biosynthesis